MKNKITIVLIVLGVVAAIAIAFYFIGQGENGAPANQLPAENQERTGNDIGQPQSKIITDDFSIDLPMGWKQTEPAMGASAMAINADEQLNDPAAKKINFRSYFAVSYDTLQGKDLSEYLQGVKVQLQQVVPSAVFAQENDTVINGQAARAMEINLTQQGVSYKILMVAVVGKGDDVWVMSFNTIESSWDAYKETFSSIAKSLSLKK